MTRAGAARRVAVVSTLIGYGAFLAGPPLLGFVGDQVGTLDSLYVVAAAMVPAAVLVLAVRRHRGSRWPTFSTPYREHMTSPIHHWIDGSSPRDLRTHGPVYNPATGEQTGERRPRLRRRGRRRVAAAAAAAREWRHASLSQRAAVLFAFRELLHERSRRARRDHHRRARQGPVRRRRRDRARPGERRVRLRRAAAAQGRVLRAGRRPGSTSTRSGSRSASSPASRRSTSP